MQYDFSFLEHEVWSFRLTLFFDQNVNLSNLSATVAVRQKISSRNISKYNSIGGTFTVIRRQQQEKQGSKTEFYTINIKCGSDPHTGHNQEQPRSQGFTPTKLNTKKLAGACKETKNVDITITVNSISREGPLEYKSRKVKYVKQEDLKVITNLNLRGMLETFYAATSSSLVS